MVQKMMQLSYGVIRGIIHVVKYPFRKGAAFMGYTEEKALFATALKEFAATLGEKIAQNDEWTIRGFIDVFKNSSLFFKKLA